MSSWEIKLLYDGDCPLCSREVRGLERMDKGRGRIAFEDIAGPEFTPGRYGLDVDQVMARIHGVLPDGSIVEGVEVFLDLVKNQDFVALPANFRDWIEINRPSRANSVR